MGFNSLIMPWKTIEINAESSTKLTPVAISVCYISSMAAPDVQELHFPPLDIPIVIDIVHRISSHGRFISQPEHYLSNLDDMVGVRVFTPTIYFYKSKSAISNDRVFEVLKEALREVLVPYYPFTGRLRETRNGKLEIFFGSDQGVLLVEAHSDVALTDLGDLSVPNPGWIKLIHIVPGEEMYKVVDMPLVIAQVTRFSCGGLSLGLRICHCLCDGLGAMQFLGAWFRTAKSGSLVVNPEPCWDREVFAPRDPPKIEFPHNEFKGVNEGSSITRSLWQGKVVQKCYRLSREYQIQLKALAQTHGAHSCTTFDAMAAHVWRSWVKAMEVEPLDYELRLTFSVNARAKLRNPPLKNGFYGNALCVACATSTAGSLANGGLAEIARLVQEARLGITEEYLRSTIDYIDQHRPKTLEFGGKLSITQWTRFSMYESADFGWGEPVYAGPIDLTPTPQMCIFLPDGAGNGAVVLCICLPENACQRFGERLMALRDAV